MKNKQEKEAACVCGRRPCTVKVKSRYMLSCPAPFECAMRSGWRGTEAEAIESWNNEVQAARHEKRRKNNG